MSRCIRNVFPILSLLADKKTNLKLFKSLIADDSAYSEDLLKSVAEIFHNILNGNDKIVPLSAAGKRLLKQHRKTIENLAAYQQSSKDRKQKKRLLLKYGPKLLPTLLPPALKVLADLVRND